jgi:hypothetical protein
LTDSIGIVRHHDIELLDQTEASVKTIQASVKTIQAAPAIGPAAYVVTANDFKVVNQGNQLYKFASDTYLIIPTINIEVENIKPWAWTNNLTLNCNKMKEIIFRQSAKVSGCTTAANGGYYPCLISENSRHPAMFMSSNHVIMHRGSCKFVA